jgi:acetoin utilization deacetylase AcuC-like enzyme
MNTAIVTSKSLVKHKTPQGHPESPERLTAIIEQLEKIQNTKWITPRTALLEELCLVHTPEYVKLVQDQVAALQPPLAMRFLSTGDVTICPDSFDAACLAAGSVLTACDAVMKKEVANAFCAVRPPGHHATSDRGMGFCLFNNVAIGAEYVKKTYGVKKIVIIDWDLHHGNGTQDIFYEDPSVFYFSTHQEAIYPGTGHSDECGRAAGLGTTMNCPIKPGAASAGAVIAAFQEKLVPAMEQFQPEFVFISAGFDAHRLDPLGALELSTAHFVLLTEIVMSIAKRWAQKRIVSVLEGGYNLEALALSAKEHLLALKNA